MQHYILVLTVIKALTVALGLVFLYFTWKAYRKSRARSMSILFVAISLMVVAAIAEGATLQIFKYGLDQAHVVEAILTFAAFAVLVYSVLSPRG